MTRRFILCLGASKSGTTWFHNFLKSQPDVYPGLRKEFAILNKLFGFSPVIFPPPTRGINSVLSRKYDLRHSEIERIGASLDSYVSYFDDLIGDGGFSMDVSPVYFMITARDLEKVILAFRARDIEVVIVVLLRDPVLRCISYGKMVQRNRFLKQDLSIQKGMELDEIVPRLVQSSNFSHDYLSVIRNVEAVQEEAKKIIFPFENAVTPEGFKCLASLLGLKTKDDFEKKIIHEDKSGQETGNVDVQVLRQLLFDQYSGCQEYFESKGILPQWHFL